MAGFNNSVSLAANTNTTLRTVTTGLTASFTTNFVNRNSFPVTVRLAHACVSATPAVDEWSIYDINLPENSVFEKTGLVAVAGKLIVVQSNNANVSVQIYGFED